ncbi:hypothetical protein DOE78_23085 [Bacillus sp. Y1]|nr:glycosyltransferase family 1 protein [Bacillus sp. Y1]AYA78050.1 hypothetical protein DOE78_23085 [Bacillus sp. Y1]
MRIGIDSLFIRPGKVGGTESYLRNLLKALEIVDQENEYIIFTSRNNDASFTFENKNFRKVLCDLDNDSRFKRMIYTSSNLPKLIEKEKIDVMFFPSYMRSFTKLKKVKTVSNVHDIQYKHYPEYFSLSKKLIFNVFYPASIYKSDHIVCISQYVKDDILNYFSNVPSEKLSVIHNPIDFDKFSKNVNGQELISKWGLQKGNYILSVASHVPHKNMETLIKAFAELKSKHQTNQKLVLVGIKDKSTGKMVELLKECNIFDETIVPGFVNDETLSQLYNNASVFVSTSLFEGFGMPPVEAMYRNVPTITTKCASLPEVTQNSAVYYNNPTDYHELAQTIQKVLLSPPDISDMPEKLVESYSFEVIGQKYKELFEMVSKR